MDWCRIVLRVVGLGCSRLGAGVACRRFRSFVGLDVSSRLGGPLVRFRMRLVVVLRGHLRAVPVLSVRLVFTETVSGDAHHAIDILEIFGGIAYGAL